jgi:hypothetical protein
MAVDVGNKILVDATITTAMQMAEQAEIAVDLITEMPMATVHKTATIVVMAIPIMVADQIQGADNLKNAIRF